MKRTLAITAATAALALSLAACGAERTDGGMPSSDEIVGGTTVAGALQGDDETYAPAETDDALRDGLGSVAGAVNRGGRGAAYGVGGPNSSVYTAKNNGGVTRAERDARAMDERYAHMLENARVHDTDGFLLDGENSSWNTF